MLLRLAICATNAYRDDDVRAADGKGLDVLRGSQGNCHKHLLASGFMVLSDRREGRVRIETVRDRAANCDIGGDDENADETKAEIEMHNFGWS
jgi:hypothetical protein